MPGDSETNEPNESLPNPEKDIPETDIPETNKPETNKPETTSDSLSSQRVFKKCSPNNKLTLYLSSRDLVVSSGRIDRLQGVLLVDPDFVEQRKVYGQVTLTFRYGREDEEVMGLKFCNEAVMCLAQLYPPHPAAQPPEGNTPLQEALLKRLGPNAYPFSMEITPLAPPSVQLVPAKEYSGAPIGTSYDVRAYIAEKLDEKLHRRTTVRMGIRVVQRAAAPPPPYLYNTESSQQHVLKQRNKNGHKIPLFSCKSAPLQTKLPETKLSLKNESRSPNIELTRKAISSKNEFDDLSTEERNSSSHNDKEVATDVEDKTSRKDVATECHLESDDNSDNIADLDVQNQNVDVVGPPEAKEETPKKENNCISDVTTNGKTPTHVSFKEQLPNEEVSTSQTNGLSQDKDKTLENKNLSEETKLLTKENEKNHQEKIEPPCGGKRPSLAAFLAQVPPPHASVEKPFLLSDGRIELEACLNKAIYAHGEEVHVSVQIRNFSNKTVKRIKVFVVQHVDVCMFSNGKFKNVVAAVNGKEDCPVSGGCILTKTYSLTPTKSTTKNWIALEDSYTKTGTSLASTVTSTSDNPQDRNVFAIYVTYYVKVKLVVSVMGGELSLKLPFTLMHTCSEFDPTWTRELESPRVESEPKPTVAEEVKPEKDGT